MRTTNHLNCLKHLLAVVFALALPLVTFADGEKWGVSEPVAADNNSLYAEIAIGVAFVIAVTLFLIWKSKHDKKEREKHAKQMQKIAANKRKAA